MDNQDNEYLRLNNEQNKDDDSISRSCFSTTKKTRKKTDDSGFLSIFKDGLKEKIPENEEEKLLPVEKPLLGTSVTFFALGLVVLILLLLILLLTKEIKFVPVIIFFATFYVPVSVVLFFYNFATRKSLSFINVLILFIVGIGTGVLCIYVNKNFNLLSGLAADSAVYFTELIVISAVFVIVLQVKKIPDNFSILLAGVSIISGFLAVNISYYLFFSLFSNVQIVDGESVKSVQAVLGTDEGFSNVVGDFIQEVLYNGLFIPLLFSMIGCILFFGLNNLISPKKPDDFNNLFSVLLVAFSFAVYVTIGISSSVVFFKVLINIVFAIFTLIVFIKVLDYSCKHEKYLD